MNARNASQDELEELKQAFESLRADVAALNENLQQVLGQTAGSETTETEEPGDLEALRRKVEELRNSGEAAARELAREVEEHPLLSVGIAFGIGYLLARVTGALR